MSNQPVTATSQPRADLLLVDDRPENLISLMAILDGLGQNLVTASSGEEALKHLLKQDFALILLDVQMSGMDGFETASLIKQRERSKYTPIIFITAINRTEEYAFQGYEVGAVDYLFKPIVPEILRAKVQTFVELYTKTEQIKQQAQHIDEINREMVSQLESVNRLNRNLEVLNREMESFSYSVSHDLRAPLRTINGFSRAIIEDYGDKLDDEGRNYLQRIGAACKRMGDLIDDLLKLSRLSRTPLSVATVDLSTIVEQVAETLRSTGPEREVEFIIQAEVMAEGDEGLLRIVIENLLSNAWKFTRKKAQALIEFGTIRQNDGALAYFVRDDGVGFEMEYSARLFSAFQRLHSELEFEGTGVGLATVQRIIHRHGGTIWAESSVGHGATFYFVLR